jgi:hypothetical protein
MAHFADRINVFNAEKKPLSILLLLLLLPQLVDDEEEEEELEDSVNEELEDNSWLLVAVFDASLLARLDRNSICQASSTSSNKIKVSFMLLISFFFAAANDAASAFASFFAAALLLLPFLETDDDDEEDEDANRDTLGAFEAMLKSTCLDCVASRNKSLMADPVRT